jgi:diaminopimelate epimerase
MNKIKFTKACASGNDFIIIDNRDNIMDGIDIRNFVINICRRRFSIGADGLILIEKSEIADFKWRFFNPDGSEAEMCGNGGRSVVKYAYLNGIAKERVCFETKAGLIEGEINSSEDVVKIQLTKPFDLKCDYPILIDNKEYMINSVNTGVPHVVMFLNDIDNIDILSLGRKIRLHEIFKPDGTNVNFVKLAGRSTISIRTYERGVEDETLSCGTGVVASAFIGYIKGLLISPINVNTRGGEILRVYIDNNNNVYLEGKVALVYEGIIKEDAYKGGLYV